MIPTNSASSCLQDLIVALIIVLPVSIFIAHSYD